MTEPKEIQQERFKRQLELADRLNKQVFIHTRDAMEATVTILK